MEVETHSDTQDSSMKPSNNAEQKEDEQEEEFLIMADIGHDIDQQTVLEYAAKSEIRAIDIDGTNPFLQIGPYTFQGEYNYVLGTNLFFSTTSTTVDDNANRNDDTTTHSPSRNNLNLIGVSDKKLNLSRVYIYPKKGDEIHNSLKSE